MRACLQVQSLYLHHRGGDGEHTHARTRTAIESISTWCVSGVMRVLIVNPLVVFAATQRSGVIRIRACNECIYCAENVVRPLSKVHNSRSRCLGVLIVFFSFEENGDVKSVRR